MNRAADLEFLDDQAGASDNASLFDNLPGPSNITLAKPINVNQMAAAVSAHSTMLPPHVIKSLGLHRGNFVVYEKVGMDGRVHRNFVTVD